MCSRQGKAVRARVGVGHTSQMHTCALGRGVPKTTQRALGRRLALQQVHSVPCSGLNTQQRAGASCGPQFLSGAVLYCDLSRVTMESEELNTKQERGPVSDHPRALGLESPALQSWRSGCGTALRRDTVLSDISTCPSQGWVMLSPSASSVKEQASSA